MLSDRDADLYRELRRNTGARTNCPAFSGFVVGLGGTVDLTVFPAQRADECQRGRCRDDDTERYDREEEVRALS